MHGTIKWFNKNRGYGVIEPFDASRDIFFYGMFDLAEADVPQEGQRVEYDENSETDENGRSIATDLRFLKPGEVPHDA